MGNVVTCLRNLADLIFAKSDMTSLTSPGCRMNTPTKHTERCSPHSPCFITFKNFFIKMASHATGSSDLIGSHHCNFTVAMGVVDSSTGQFL